jgi:CheY-like chemotaxis protein
MEGGMKYILLIDDNEGFRCSTRRVLERAGYDVAEACDGAQAMVRFRQVEPDLIITDMLMPEKDGIEVIQELKKHSPKVRIIAMSGGGPTEPELRLPTLKAAQYLGAARTLAKPFDVPCLLETVAEVLADPR